MRTIVWMKYLIVSFLFIAQLSVFAQENMLCQGAYWTEDEANVIMKKWASEWKTKADWEKRAEVIRQGIIKGMKFDQMPAVGNDFKPIIQNTRTMDGYIVENIAIESFSRFLYHRKPLPAN
jgi:uncharacterized protein